MITTYDLSKHDSLNFTSFSAMIIHESVKNKEIGALLDEGQ